MNVNRWILHCDIDCFYASVEARDNPSYKGIPLIIGADPKAGKGRGVVLTASYEARKFGLHSGMPISRAYRLCPQGTYVRPIFKKYLAASKEVMKIISKYSTEFQRVGLDEAYIDISNTCFLPEDVKETAEKIQREVYKKVGITCSIGCAPTKSLAKIATDFHKPNGITLIEPNKTIDFLKDMDISCISGVGKKTKYFFYNKGVNTIGDLLEMPTPKIKALFGSLGLWVWKVAHGLDLRPVKEFHERKSISKERTFYSDTSDYNTIVSTFEKIADKLTKKLRKHGFSYRTVSIKVRFEGYITYIRSKTLAYPTNDKKNVLEVVFDLYNEFSEYKKKVRLIGVKLSNFEKTEKIKQLNLIPFI